MVLLEVSGMDLHFNTKDVIYIVGFIVTLLTAWSKMKLDKAKMQNDIAINTKHIDKNETTMFKKLTNVHTRMDKNEEQNKGEFDSIKKELAALNSGISTINGKLDILISK